MDWKIRTRLDGWKESDCEHGQPHVIYPHLCDFCCHDESFPLDKMLPSSIGPLAVQVLPRAFRRLRRWPTAQNVLQLLLVDTLTQKELLTRIALPDTKEALLWLHETGLVNSGLTRDLTHRTFSISSFGRMLLRDMHAEDDFG